MNLIPIPDYPNYSLDKNNNQVYGHFYKKFLTPNLAKGYYQIGLYKNNKRKYFQLHRIIYQAHYPNIDITNLHIDHIDNNRTNNNINNLRHCNRSENNCNIKVKKTNLSTGIKNIYKTKSNTYQVVIYKNNKVVYRKTFKNLENAIEYRNIKLKELHGDFAKF